MKLDCRICLILLVLVKVAHASEGDKGSSQSKIFERAYSASNLWFDIDFSFGENSTKERYLPLSFQKIDTMISMDVGVLENYFASYEEDENGIFAMKENLFSKEVFDEILELNKEIPPYYLKLSHYITLTGFNLIDTPKFRQFHKAVVLLYAVHWIMDDITDRNKRDISDDRFLAHALTLHLSGLNGSIPNLSDFELLGQFVEDQTLVLKTQIASRGLAMAVSILKDEMCEEAYELFANHYRDAINIFATKFHLRTSESSLDKYQENRAFSTGCIPYMNLKYFAYAAEEGLSEEFLLHVIKKYSEIRDIEIEANILDGYLDDAIGFVKDEEEDTANLVHVIANSRRLGKFDAEKEAIAYNLGLYKKLKNRLQNLYDQSLAEEKEYIQVIARGILQDLFGVVVIHFHFPKRYAKDVNLMKIMNRLGLSEEEKRVEFDVLYRSYKTDEKCKDL